MKKIKSFFAELWNDESGQGATEYILLLVIVIAVAAIFKDKIKEVITSKMEDVGGKIGGFNEN